MRFVESQKEVIDTLRKPAQHSATERKRAYLFLTVYIIAAIGFGCNAFHFISGWIGLLMIQLIQIIFSVMYVFNINDYADKQSTALECERACNPLLDAYFGVRIVQAIMALWLRSYIAFPVFVLALAFHLWRVKKGHQYVDATNLWREVRKNEKESYFNCAIDVTLIVIVMTAMIFSIIGRYS